MDPTSYLPKNLKSIGRRKSALVVGPLDILIRVVLYESQQFKPMNNKAKVSLITQYYFDIYEASKLCYAWGKIRDQQALMLFSTHNIISTRIATKLKI